MSKTETKPARVKHAYEATITGWVAGRRVKEGDPLSLTEAEAKYAHVRPVAAKPAATKRSAAKS